MAESQRNYDKRKNPDIKPTYQMMSFMWNSRKGRSIVIESRAMVGSDGGSGCRLTAKGHEGTFLVW